MVMVQIKPKNFVKLGEILCEEVNDFVFLQKEAIWTIATSALQKVDKQLQEEKQKVADLLARVEALENR